MRKKKSGYDRSEYLARVRELDALEAGTWKAPAEKPISAATARASVVRQECAGSFEIEARFALPADVLGLALSLSDAMDEDFCDLGPKLSGSPKCRAVYKH